MSSEKDTLFQQIERTEDFVFDERVANVFDNMVSRSVPFYNEIQRLQSDLVMEFLPTENGVICDLGCSTGTTLAHIAQHASCPETTQFIGFDNSAAMLDKAKQKLVNIPAQQLRLLCADLSTLNEIPPCHVVILNWTLQFVRPIEREYLLKHIYNALQPGGAIFLSEKILANDAQLNRLYIDHYLEFKKSHSGYTDLENQRKREALENILIPYKLDENYALLQRAGFTRMDTYFRWLNFACLLAIKT